MKILVTGAAGFIGHPLVDRLVREGHAVRALVRAPRGDLKPSRTDLEVLIGDLRDAATLERAVQGREAVVHLANATAVVKLARARAINVAGTQALLDAAKRAGVQRFIFTSTLSALRRRVGPYGRTKREAEERVRASGLPFVILRPSLVYGGRGPGLVPTLAAYLRGLPAVPVIGSGRIELDPIHLDDVCEVIVQCLSRDDVLGRSYDLLGPDRVTFNQFLERLSQELGVRTPLVHLPGEAMLLLARVLCAVTDRPPVTVDNVLGLIADAPADPEAARRDFRIAWTPLSEGLPRALDPAPLPALEFRGATAPSQPALAGSNGTPAPRRPIRVGVVGLGKMGVAHTAVLSMIPGVTIAGLSDLHPALGKSLRGMGFNAPFHPSLDALLAEGRPEAVWVCTPPDSHEPVARRCLEAGAAVFVEKPLAQDLEPARRLVALAARHGRPVGCGYTLAFWPSFAAARQVIAVGAVGPIRGGRSSMYLSQVFGPQKGWIADPARSGGGVVANISSHLLFVLRWCLGVPVEARATWKKIHGAVEDELSGAFRFEGGAEVGFETSWSVPDYPVSETVLEVEGENGFLRVANEVLELDLHAARGGWPAGATRLAATELPQSARFDLNGEGYYLEDAHFLAWATGGPEPPTTAEAGLEVQRMMSALYASAAGAGGWVEVPR